VSTARDHQRKQVAAVVARHALLVCRWLERFSSELLMAVPDSHQKGMAWQSEFALLAGKRGLHVAPGDLRADLRVAGKRVQCKNIDAVTGKRIDISNMRPVLSNGGYRGYLAHELDVLALRHLGVLYLIPKDSICNERGQIASRVSLVSVSKFQDNWSVFQANYVPPPSDRQQTLFEQE
jgi:hypothetical protein